MTGARSQSNIFLLDGISNIDTQVNSAPLISQDIQRLQQDAAQYEKKRKNFESGRNLLLEKGAAFEPDELLADNWRKALKSALDGMPEMKNVLHEKGPLHGAYFADTLYLPEITELSNDTILVVNHLVFEGTHPIIKGPHDLHVFPISPTVVLDTTLSELLHRNPRVLNVSVKKGNRLPSFVLIRQLVNPSPHIITYDTSALEPHDKKRSSPKNNVSLKAISLVNFSPMLFQDNTDGAGGATGTAGTWGTPGNIGFDQPAAPDGSCPNQPTGQPGQNGGSGLSGGDGSDGGTGGRGGDAGNQNHTIADGDNNQHVYYARGGVGGTGGEGGPGGAAVRRRVWRLGRLVAVGVVVAVCATLAPSSTVKPSEFSLGTTDLVRGDFTKAREKLTMRQTSLVKLQKNFAISFTFIGESRDEVNELIEKLSFDQRKTAR